MSLFLTLRKRQKNLSILQKNGEGDIVLMDINAFEKREQVLKLRARVLQAEEERINGANTISVAEARKRLRERTDEM